MSEIVELKNIIDPLVSRRMNGEAVAVDSLEKYNELRSFCGMDYRASDQDTFCCRSTLSGLAFDSGRVTSEVFSLGRDGGPMGLMTLIIAPRIWMQRQRYIELLSNREIVVRSFEDIYGQEPPDYVLIPGWTYVLPEYRTSLALTGFRFFQEAKRMIVETSPGTLGIELNVQGSIRTNDLLTYISQPGDRISGNFQGFDWMQDIISKGGPTIYLDQLVGAYNDNATSSIKMAEYMKLKHIPNIGNFSGRLSGGPVFYDDITYK